MKNPSIRYSRGGQFKGGVSIFFFFVSLGLLIALVYSFYHGHYLAMLIKMIILFISLFITLDIRGVEISLEKDRIREYQLELWGRTGSWYSLDPFSEITLDLDTFSITYSDGNIRSGESGSYTQNHHYYIVKLVGDKTDKEYILGEKSEYKEAKQLMKNASKKLGFETRDIFQERLKASKRRRRR